MLKYSLKKKKNNDILSKNKKSRTLNRARDWQFQAKSRQIFDSSNKVIDGVFLSDHCLVCDGHKTQSGGF